MHSDGVCNRNLCNGCPVCTVTMMPCMCVIMHAPRVLCDVFIIFPVCVRYVAVMMEGGARARGGDVAGPTVSEF